ncbi:unnamed protein product, partial [Trichobilharzia regenti]
MNRTFTPFVNPVRNLNPGLITSLPGGGQGQLGGALSSLANSRKPCNCTKSHCLKLYCECFAQGQLCQNCNCHNCMNNLAYEEERGRAIKMTLERNPTAFHPKIGRGEGERKHTKGFHTHPLSGIHTLASIDDNEQGLTHSGGSTGPGSLGGKGRGVVGVAAAAAAAADVLQDDEDEENEMLNEMDVDDADDMEDE